MPSITDADVKKAQNFDDILKRSQVLANSKQNAGSAGRATIFGLLLLLLMISGIGVYYYHVPQNELASHKTTNDSTTPHKNDQLIEKEASLPPKVNNIDSLKEAKAVNEKRLQESQKSVLVDKTTATKAKQVDATPVKTVDTAASDAAVIDIKEEITDKENSTVVTTDDSNEEEEEEILPFEEAKPVPGFPALYQYFSDELTYPDELRADSIKGTVEVYFVISTEGTAEKFKIVKSLNPLMDQEALRVMKSMPAWYPAKRWGEPVKTNLTLPLTFKIKEK